MMNIKQFMIRNTPNLYNIESFSLQISLQTGAEILTVPTQLRRCKMT